MGLNNNMILMISENKQGFSKRQIDDAIKARKLYHILGCPTVQNFKHILRQNTIQNCPITTKDVDRAEKIFGADIGTMKGKIKQL